MKYRETAAKVSEQLGALEKLEGYPIKPSFVGAALRRIVPDTHSPGAVGWTDKIVERVDVGDGDLECEVPDEILARHRGKTVVLDGKQVVVDVKPRTKPAAPSTPKTR